MPIPESQLETWAHQGSISQSSDTYQTIKTALESENAQYAKKSYEVFLQGSYGNDTNIYAESDVDIVIRLDSIFRSDISALSPEEQQAYRQAFEPATYTLDEFKKCVVLRLENAFGKTAVKPGNKAIKLPASGSRRNADVVVCHELRRYTSFSNGKGTYVSGIIFPSIQSGEVRNYPLQHSENCTAKHKATFEWFKPLVRIVKNMRSKLVDDGVIGKEVAPSYYIEGLLYNVPSDRFGKSYEDSFVNAINWLHTTDRTQLKCANEQYLLLGHSNVQWSSTNCDKFLGELINLWNSW